MENTILDVLADTMIHKDIVLACCWKMAQHFIDEGEKEKAIEILERGWSHDNSKFSDEEMECLIQISDNHESMRCADVQLPEQMKEFLRLHYQNNTHHPEHWDDVSLMPEMDIVEMVCDWNARSIQYGTDLMEFVRTRQECRFHFPPEMFERIIELCEILLE